MHRVHQMILTDVGCGGLDAARARLKKTPETTVVYADGTRLKVSRCEDGSEREEVVSQRSEDLQYLGLGSYPTALEAESVPAAHLQPVVEEDFLDVSEVPRFDVDDPAFLAHLEEHGYAVLKDVASSSERIAAEMLLWQFLKEQAGIDRDDPATWSDENFERIGCVGTGIIDGGGIGQSDFLWCLRLLPTVKTAFAKIWGTDDLLTSFDAANVFRPWQHKELGFSRTHGGWYHVDQGRGAPGLQAVQGLVSLLDADLSTGGLVVIPHSHKHHEELVRFQYTDDNYFSVPAFDSIMELPKKLITCRAGDLVLWDSRCVHCNAPGRLSAMEVHRSAPPKLLRAVGYICMTPKSKASEDVLRLRREAYEQRITTNHWPHLFNPVRAGKRLKVGNGPSLALDDEKGQSRLSMIC
jgi:hypothetical protein